MSIDKISMERIADRILPVHFRTTEPVLILGEPGIGKTEIVLQSIRALLEEAYAPKKGEFDVKQFYTIIDGSGMPSESLVIPYSETLFRSSRKQKLSLKRKKTMVKSLSS